MGAKSQETKDLPTVCIPLTLPALECLADAAVKGLLAGGITGHPPPGKVLGQKVTLTMTAGDAWNLAQFSKKPLVLKQGKSRSK